ncbi:MAG: L-lactate dehydrogenase [Candidatus Kaelpia aquatica]|nr:L-lactate dehydrogenase [Candidatus Kaelpia aquatica]
MNNLNPKVSIIGAGNVGMRYAYALTIKGLAREIVIVDLDKERLSGEVMDLSHTAPYVSPVEIIGGDYSDTVGSDLVVITAGAKQEVGQSRLDLIEANVKLFKKIIPLLMQYTPEAIFLNVTNPVDLLSYVSYKLSSKPSNEVIGSGTVLDTARFRNLLAHHVGVDPRNIHAYILGEHGDSEFPVWSKAMVGGVLFKDYCPKCCRRGESCSHQEELGKIFKEVKDSAYNIIERKGETSYGIGLALVRITEAILNNENAILPVSSLMQGYLGIKDLYLSLPSVVNRSGLDYVLNIELNEEEQKSLKNSAEIIREKLNKVGF